MTEPRAEQPEWVRLMLGTPWPERPADEVYPGLWIGGCAYGRPDPGYFDVVYTLTAAWEGANDVHRGTRHVRWPIHDSDAVRVDPGELARVVANVVALVRAGDKVLVRCWMGLNRSGLVVALALAELTGLPGAACARAIRAQRSPSVLCNPYFAGLVDAVPARPPNERTRP